MEPDRLRVGSIEDLHLAFSAFRPLEGMMLFRGHADQNWPLVPKAGRASFFLPDILTQEKAIRFRDLGRFHEWKRNVYPFIPDLPANDYEALAYAQHHGLATRLLDWSLNPLVATYFSVRELPDTDGAVICYRPHGVIKPQGVELPMGRNQMDKHCSEILDAGGDAARQLEADLSDLHGRAIFTRAFDGRMLNQRGAFTAHWPPNAPLPINPCPPDPTLCNLAVLSIGSSLKRTIREHLYDYGISDEFVYPDADGVASHINWKTQRMITRATTP